jgi:hypothetical protein
VTAVARDTVGNQATATSIELVVANYGERLHTVTAVTRDYFTFACAFRRSAQYRFIRSDTAWRAATDIRVVFRVA